MNSRRGRTHPRGWRCWASPAISSGTREPGDEASIADLCELNFGVAFPQFAKIDGNGSDAHPLYRWLREEKSGILGDALKWNVTKLLVGRDGAVLKRFASTTTPDQISSDFEAALTS